MHFLAVCVSALIASAAAAPAKIDPDQHGVRLRCLCDYRRPAHHLANLVLLTEI